ncbi:uncharacterized protein PAE49_001282 isoform 2-T2 [Odontesthes bonariensis]|uniref:uncharacterized protein LOC142374100 n=1 Tax=Odontesthes bonariensis TaxID=219752 RepID=UPI003F58C36B
MENPDKHEVLLQCVGSVGGSKMLDTGVSSETEQQQTCPPESIQEIPGQRGGDIKLRIQQLENRCLLLQHCIKKQTQNCKGTTKEITSEDDEEQCELETIRKELEELYGKEEEMKKNGASSKPQANGGNQKKPAIYKETPHGGIYILPPVQLEQKDATAAQPTSPIIPESLGPTAELTKCPTCEEVVVTETSGSMGEAAWTMCILSSLMGCVAGCCLVPFCMKRLRNVHHQCPHCGAHIHTYKPM